MENALSLFIMGFICTACLLLLCFFTVIGVKFALLTFKDAFNFNPKLKDNIAPPQKKKRTKKHTAKIQPSRSIEIDPDQIDKIYVKKIS